MARAMRARGVRPRRTLREAGLAAVLGSALASPALSQSAPRPEDVATLDGIIRAYYEVVSGPAGELPQIERDHTLHHPDALVGFTGIGEDGTPFVRTMSLDGYYENNGGPRSEPFYEYEIHREVQRFGNIAHVWSTYASSREPDGEPFARGINSIQLYFDGARWWILGWVFDSERDGNPIPSRYVP